MSTQDVSAYVGSSGANSFSRQFTKSSATDNSWNVLTSANSSVNLGLEMPGAAIDFVQGTYAAGGALWRIQSSKTLVVKRQGYCTKATFTNPEDCKIPPYVVQPDDILSIYPVVVNGTSNKTNALAWIYTSNGVEAFAKLTIADSTATEITSIVNLQSLGDWAFGSILQGVTVQLQDAAQLSSIEIIDNTGGTVYSSGGGFRGGVAGSNSNYYNAYVNMNIPIQKGWTLKLTTVK